MNNFFNFNNFEYDDFKKLPLEELKEMFNIGEDSNIDVKVIFNNQIMNLIKELENSMEEKDINEITCPNCGTKLSELKITQMAGCEVCYSCFKNEIENLLKSKNLMPTTRENSKKSYMDDLRKELDIAIRTEDYERAQEIKAMMENIE